MAVTAQQQLEKYLNDYGDASGAASTIENRIREANSPTIEGLNRDLSTIAPQAMGNFAQAFANMGTAANGMSPSARIANAQFKGAEAMLNRDQNRNLQNYWRTSINDLIGKANTGYQQGQASALTAYNLLNQREQEAFQQDMARQQLALQRAALAWSQREPTPWKRDPVQENPWSRPLQTNIAANDPNFTNVLNRNSGVYEPVLNAKGKKLIQDMNDYNTWWNTKSNTWDRIWNQNPNTNDLGQKFRDVFFIK